MLATFAGEASAGEAMSRADDDELVVLSVGVSNLQRSHPGSTGMTDRPSQTIPDNKAMTFLTCKPQVEELLRLDTPFSEIEQQIDSALLCDEEKAALWLYAWSVTHRSQLSEAAHGGSYRDVQHPAGRRRS